MKNGHKNEQKMRKGIHYLSSKAKIPQKLLSPQPHKKKQETHRGAVSCVCSTPIVLSFSLPPPASVVSPDILENNRSQELVIAFINETLCCSIWEEMYFILFI